MALSVTKKGDGTSTSMWEKEWKLKSEIQKRFLNVRGDLFEANVVPARDQPRRQMSSYKVVRVVSPFEFYMEYAPDPRIPSWNRNLKQGEWFNRMQTFYNDPENNLKYRLDNDIAVTMVCYVCQYVDSSDSTPSWQRVRVYEAKYKQQKALVFYVDLDKFEEVSFQRLRRIAPQFCTWQSQVFRCYLYDLVPSTVDKTGLVWSQDACAYFRELLMGRNSKGKEFYGGVLARSNSLVNERMPEIHRDVGVVLFAKPGYEESLKCSINSMMVKKGFASPTGIFAFCNHLFSSDPESEPVFEEAEFYSAYPELSEVKAQEQSTSTDISPSIVSAIAKYHVSNPYGPLLANRPKMPWLNPYLVKSVEYEGIAENVENRTSVMADYEMFPKKFRHLLAYVQNIPSCVGPHYMIIHLQSRHKHLKQMEKCLEELMESQAPTEESGKLAIGQFTASVVKIDKNEIWARGFIQDIAKGKVDLLLVDYGTSQDVSPETCRPLPSHFQTIPSFAIRAHMDRPEIVPKQPNSEKKNILKWSKESCSRYSTFLNDRRDINDIMYTYRPKSSQVIELDYFEQVVAYNQKKKQWVASNLSKGKKPNGLVNQLKNHPLLKPLHVSIGVDLWSEYSLDKSAFWHFAPMWEGLWRDKYGNERVSDNKARFHWHLLTWRGE